MKLPEKSVKIQKTILGIMSGTSLDGVDFALCSFEKTKKKYSYKILKTGFLPYNDVWKKQLSKAQNLDAYEFLKLHKKYGSFIGEKTNEFLKNEMKPDFIASHGHTIFHHPGENLTFQIGDGAFISAETGIPVISDFRNLDTAMGGQGAPLVPIGDKLLFSKYDYCINLGGFANISYDEKEQRNAYDICPFNLIINHFANLKGKEFDKDGEMGKNGNVNQELLTELSNIEYYFQKPPKSLSREYVEKYYFPIFNQYKISVEDILRTYYEHAAFKIKQSIVQKSNRKVLVTGGGTHNRFFISLLQNFSEYSWIVPDKEIIDFKEAIIFAFLGFLRSIGKINTLASVTGATRDTSGGCIFII